MNHVVCFGRAKWICRVKRTLNKTTGVETVVRNGFTALISAFRYSWRSLINQCCLKYTAVDKDTNGINR